MALRTLAAIAIKNFYFFWGGGPFLYLCHFQALVGGGVGFLVQLTAGLNNTRNSAAASLLHHKQSEPNPNAEGPPIITFAWLSFTREYLGCRRIFFFFGVFLIEKLISWWRREAIVYPHPSDMFSRLRSIEVRF